MKFCFSALCIATIPFGTLAQTCSQQAVFALSPYTMVCAEYKTSCDIPKESIRVASCDMKKIVQGMTKPDITGARDSAANARQSRAANGSQAPLDPFNPLPPAAQPTQGFYFNDRASTSSMPDSKTSDSGSFYFGKRN